MDKQEYYFTYKDLEIGKTVRVNQLAKLTDTYVILKDMHPSRDYLGLYTTEGTIQDFYRDKKDAKAPDKLVQPAMLIYNPPESIDWNITY